MRRGPAGAVQSQVAAGAAAAGKNLAHLLLPSLSLSLCVCVCVCVFRSQSQATSYSSALALPGIDVSRFWTLNVGTQRIKLACAVNVSC